MFQYFEMFVIRYNIFGIGSNGTIYKLVVISILGNQSEMDVNFLIDGGT